MKYALIIAVMMMWNPAHRTSYAADGNNIGNIIVTVVNIRPDQEGSLIFALYKGDEHWLDLKEAFATKVIPVQADSVTILFEKIQFDSIYAVQVVHDKNGNGKLDFRKFPFPKPKEGTGVSNNHIRMGPPDYNEAKFSLFTRSVSLRINVSY
jgi:uncharacterized protein (DUF2141 family)